MAESKFNQKFREKLSAYPLCFHFDRIESHATAPGIPDNRFIRMGYSGWLEMKQEPRMITGIDYRPNQAPWLMLEWKRGGACGTIVHVVSSDVVLLVRGCDSLVALRDVRKVAQTIALREEGAWERIADWIMGLRHAPEGLKSS